jgi:hypothetical protein
LDPIAELCSQTKALDIKAKKKAKAEEVAQLSKLGFEDIKEKAKLPKDVEFEPFKTGDYRNPKLNIPSNINASDPLALFDLFIPPEMYEIVAKNTNLYAIAHNAPISRTTLNSRYWWPTTAYEIRVLFGILFYIGAHKEASYKTYWETPGLIGPKHELSKYMSLNRYENLRRYFHISPPKSQQSQQSQQS